MEQVETMGETALSKQIKNVLHAHRHGGEGERGERERSYNSLIW